MNNEDELEEQIASERAYEEEAQRLRAKYPKIVELGKALMSYDYYIDNQCYQAEQDNAPRNATYKRNDGTWATEGPLLN